MCGIVGVITSPTGPHSLTGWLRDAMRIGGVRGEDSTGIFQASRDRASVLAHKAAISGELFSDTKMARHMISDAHSMPVTIGHHRAATAGSVNNQNAHPFTHTRTDGTELIGVHNGVLSSWGTKEQAASFDVDSDWALWQIADKGVEAYKMFDGSYAFVYYDTHYKKLFVGCNVGRALHFAFIENHQSLVLCSEAKMLDWLADRNNLNIEEIQRFEPGKLYEFEPSNPRVFSTSDLPEADVPKYREVNSTWEDWHGRKDNKYNTESKLPVATTDKSGAETQRLIKVLREERELAKKLGVLNTEVVFRITNIVPDFKYVQGEAYIPEQNKDKAGSLLTLEPYEATIRRFDMSDPNVRAKFRGIKRLKCRIMGVAEQVWRDGATEMRMILTKPHEYVYGKQPEVYDHDVDEGEDARIVAVD